MKNNWYVVTGAPSSGKSTTLEALKKKGYKVQEEWARIYIDQEMKKGKAITEIRADERKFQEKILELKIDFEKSLNPKELIFLERGIPDTTAYNRMIGIKIDKKSNDKIRKSSYKKVFLLELVKYESDYARTESQEEAMILENLLEESYKNLSMNVIRVPKIPVDKRVEFILKNL